MEYKYPAVTGGGGSADTAKSLIVTVRNNTGTLIPKRSPVYINGALGNRPTIALASNTSEATSSKTLGFTTTDIADNVDGEVIVFGRLEGVNTQVFSPGQALWLGDTAGTITTTKPVAPNHMVFLGVVVIANPANGVIEVSVQNGFELQELHNVLITSPANSQTLVYDSATSLWKNSTIVNAGVDANANIAVSKLASLTANKIAVTDGSGKLATNSGAVTDNEVVAYNAGTLYTVAGVTNTKVGYLSNVTSDIQTQINSKLASALKGAPNGLAELDGSGKVPSTQLPAYVDDVLEYANLAAFPVTGTSGIIYIALDTNLCYRWSGSTYTEISPSLALGETASTAYRGDRGLIAYDHSQYMGNPHFTDISQISGVSSYALGLLNDTTATEARTTLGLGTIATQNANSVNISGGSVNTTVSNRLRASVASLAISGGSLAATTGFVRLTAGETVLDTISDPSGILAVSGVNLVLHNYTVGADVTITNVGNILTGTGDSIILKQNASIAFVHNGNSKWSVVNYVTGGLTPSPLAATLALAVKNTHYLTNTSGGSFNVTLPAGAIGSVIRFSDANETWDTNALTIIPATGEKIGTLAVNTSLTCNVKRGWVELSWNAVLNSWSLQSWANLTTIAASATQPGIITTGTQTLPGTKTVAGNLYAEQESGTEVDLAAIGYGVGPVMHGYFANGSKATPTAATSNQLLWGIGCRPHTGSGFTAHSTAALHFVSRENISPTAQGTSLRFIVTPNGTTEANRQTAFRVECDSTTEGPRFRIKGAGVLKERFAIQGLSADGVNTSFNILPASISGAAQLNHFNNPDPTNASYIALRATSTSMDLLSGPTGSGTILPLAIYTNNLERMRVQTGGGVSINSTADNGNVLVQNKHIEVRFAPGAGNTSYYKLHHDGSTLVYHNISSNTNYDIVNYSNGVRLPVNGTSWGAISDERKKKNVKPLEYGLTEISALRPVRFDYKTEQTDTSARIGFVAQEVASVVKEAVHGSEETEYSVTSSDLIPILVKAIQELSIKVNAQAEEIKALTNK